MIELSPGEFGSMMRSFGWFDMERLVLANRKIAIPDVHLQSQINAVNGGRRAGVGPSR